MADKRIKVRLGHEEVEATEVFVDESNERWSELRLSDGTFMKVKLSVISVARTDRFDMNDNPIYSINATPTLAIVSVPEQLRKKKDN